MAYDNTTGMWKPEATGNTVAEKVTGMMSASNPYMEQAKSAGTEYANSRGLLNSSIAAGASQKAAYDAVLPIATADANIAAQKDISAQGYKQTGDLQGGQIASTEKISGQQIGAQKENAVLQSDTQKSIASMNVASADKQQLLALSSQERIAGSQQGTQLEIANMNVSANKQDKAQAAAVSYANIYGGMVNAINGNKDIPADARAAYLSNAKVLYDNGLNLVQQTYDVQLDWGQGGAPGATGSATPGAAASLPAYNGDPNAGTAQALPYNPANYAPASGVNYDGNPNYGGSGGGVAYTDSGGNQFDSNGNYLGTI